MRKPGKNIHHVVELSRQSSPLTVAVDIGVWI